MLWGNGPQPWGNWAPVFIAGGSPLPPGPTIIEVRHEAAYSGMVERRHEAAYRDLAKLERAHVAPYDIRQAVHGVASADYAILDYNPIAVAHAARYAINTLQIQSVANEPQLIHNGSVVRLLDCTLSCDEGSPYWLARIGIAEPGDYAAIAVRDAITLALGVETFSLVVDGRENNRDAPAGYEFSITAISPAALLDEPFAEKTTRTWATATLASQLVADLLGPVTWELQDWMVSPANSAFDGATPMAAARAIVEAIGGVIESNPDGSLVCRSAYPVPVTAYPLAPTAHHFSDADLIGERESIKPTRGYNRVIVTNEGGSSAGTDALEYVQDEGDSGAGTVRAVLAVDRPVTLVHTSTGVSITPRGKVQRTEREVVEFVEGAASIRYNADALVAVTYKANDLGTVVANGSTLSALVAGYSLAVVEYLTSAHEWGVSKEADDEVQFVLMDA